MELVGNVARDTTQGKTMSLIRIREVKREIGHRSNASIYTDVKNGLLTPPVSIGQRAKAWPDHEVHAVVLARIAGKSRDEICGLVKALVAKRSELFIRASSQLDDPCGSLHGAQTLTMTQVAQRAVQEICDLPSFSDAKRGELMNIKS